MISRAVSIVIFFAALLGTGTFLSEIRPFATVPVLREKIAWFVPLCLVFNRENQLKRNYAEATVKKGESGYNNLCSFMRHPPC